MKTFLCMDKQHMQQGKNEWWKKQNLAKTSNLLSKGSFHFWVTWTAIHNNSSLCLDWQSKLIRQKRLEMPNIHSAEASRGWVASFRMTSKLPLQQKNWKHVKLWCTMLQRPTFSLSRDQELDPSFSMTTVLEFWSKV